MFGTLTAALLGSVVAAFVVVFLTGGGVLTALLTAGVTGYFIGGWLGAAVGALGVVGVSALVVRLGGEVGPDHRPRVSRSLCSIRRRDTLLRGPLSKERDKLLAHAAPSTAARARWDQAGSPVAMGPPRRF